LTRTVQGPMWLIHVAHKGAITDANGCIAEYAMK